MQQRKATTSGPARFLTMGSEALIERYSSEKAHLVTLHADAIHWTIPEVVVIDTCKQLLPITAITVQHDPSSPEYTIPARIAGQAEDILSQIHHFFYDSATVRLNGLQNNGNRLTLNITKAHYLHSVATNYSMDAYLKEKGWTCSLRDLVHPTPHLCRLEESLLCNHIGVGMLIFTRDNFLVLPIRSKNQIATWQQMVSPSISGAASYDDDLWHAKAGLTASWIREGRKGLGLDEEDFVEGGEIFLGLTRDLLRGGKA